MRKGGKAWPGKPRDDEPRIDPERGLDWFGTKNGDQANADRNTARGRRAVGATAAQERTEDQGGPDRITDDEEEIERMREAWNALGTDIGVVIVESPYRPLVRPLPKYIDEIDQQRPDDTLTIVLPEFIARHWWEHLLHNRTALRIKAALLFRLGAVVISVPYHLERAAKRA